LQIVENSGLFKFAMFADCGK